MKLRITNLELSINETDLATVFSEYGLVQTVRIIEDRFTGSFNRIGIVEMPNYSEAEKAQGSLNGKTLKGEVISIN